MNDDYLNDNFIVYNPDDDEEDNSGKVGNKAKRVKKPAGRGRVFVFIGIILIAIAIIAGGTAWGIVAYNAQIAEEERVYAENKYKNLIKKAEASIEDEDFDGAMDYLEAALDIEVDNYKDVYKVMGNVYVGYAGEKYVEGKKLIREEKYDMALDALSDASDYLDQAEKAWKKGKGKFNSDIFYDCNSIADARNSISSAEEQIAEDSAFSEVALQLFADAWKYLDDEDYDSMNELDCSDESNDVFGHYVGGAYGKRLIATYEGSELKLVDDANSFSGIGISQNSTSTGFYYYKGHFDGGVPDGDGILYISSTNGDYHVEIGNFTYGYLFGEATYIVRNRGKVTCYEGEISDWGYLDGEIKVTKEVNGQLLTGTAYYEYDEPVSLAEKMDEEEYEALVSELEENKDNSNPFGGTSTDDEYYAFLYNKKGELVAGMTKSDMDTTYLHY